MVDVFQPADALPVTCRQSCVRQLDLFGSAATGRGFDPERSDIDVLVTFEDMLPGEHAKAWFGLHEALETLAGRKVDLVTESAIRIRISSGVSSGNACRCSRRHEPGSIRCIDLYLGGPGGRSGDLPLHGWLTL